MERPSQAKLLHVDKSLSSDDLNSMVFLCREIVGKAQLGKLTRGIHLIEDLQKKFPEKSVEKKTYTWFHLFKELLYHAGRKDLLRSLGTTKDVLAEQIKTNSLVDPFTLLLFEIGQQIIPKELNDIKFIYFQSNWAQVENVDDPITVFMMLETSDIIGKSRLHALKEVVEAIKRRDILKKIDCYEKNFGEWIFNLDLWFYHISMIIT